MADQRKPIASVRWWTGGLLFASTVINYIDWRAPSLLARYLKLDYQWTNSDSDFAVGAQHRGNERGFGAADLRPSIH
jgi:hypothetical protein